MQSVKIVVTGPERSGTTTFIRGLSEIAVLTTERTVRDSALPGRESVIPMDFGRVTVDDEHVLYLFGTSGESDQALRGGPFSEGLIGVIVMVDVTRHASIERAHGILAHLRDHADVTYVIAANHPRDAVVSTAGLAASLGVSDDASIIECDASDRASAKGVVVALLDRILREMPDERPTFDGRGIL